MGDMTATEIIKNLNPAQRALLAEVPGYPVAVGTVVEKIEPGTAAQLRAAGVIGPRGGLTIKGAVVVDKIKAASELF